MMAAGLQNDHDPGLNHDSGFFWDNINQQWQWMDFIDPYDGDTSAYAILARSEWGSNRDRPNGDAGSTHGEVVFLSQADLGISTSSNSEEGGGAVTVHSTLKLRGHSRTCNSRSRRTVLQPTPINCMSVHHDTTN